MSPEEHHEPHPEVPPEFHPEIPEQRQDPRFRKWWVGGWLSPLLVAGGMLAWCFLIYLLIGNRPTDWKYGVIPYVPGESIFSIEPPPRGEIPRQVVLPEQASEDADENR